MQLKLNLISFFQFRCVFTTVFTFSQCFDLIENFNVSASSLKKKEKSKIINLKRIYLKFDKFLVLVVRNKFKKTMVNYLGSQKLTHLVFDSISVFFRFLLQST